MSLSVRFGRDFTIISLVARDLFGTQFKTDKMVRQRGGRQVQLHSQSTVNESILPILG